jgi:hypothetical protein
MTALAGWTTMVVASEVERLQVGNPWPVCALVTAMRRGGMGRSGH